MKKILLSIFLVFHICVESQSLLEIMANASRNNNTELGVIESTEIYRNEFTDLTGLLCDYAGRELKSNNRNIGAK